LLFVFQVFFANKLDYLLISSSIKRIIQMQLRNSIKGV